MDDARLDGGLGEDRLDRLREPFEPVDTRRSGCLCTPRCLSSVRTCIQNFAPSGLLKPHPEHVAVAVEGDAQREVTRAALHRPALADLQHQRVEDDDRVDVLQRPLRPVAHVVDHRVGDPADQIAADLDAVDLLEVRLDIARREPAAVEAARILSSNPSKGSLALRERSSAQSCRRDRAARRSRPAPAR